MKAFYLFRGSIGFASLRCLSALTALLSVAVGAAIPEPETIFYGRVVSRTGDTAERLLTQGSLAWKLRIDGKTERTFECRLESLDGGRFSYQLRIPHQSLTLGLTHRGDAIPLGTEAAMLSTLEILVDDQPARMVTPGNQQLEIEQALRARTFRLDLVVAARLEDTDRDGLPDWWEDEHGLDSRWGGDASLDPDGDGLPNTLEFLSGSDPSRDDRIPTLAHREYLVGDHAESGLLLRVIDSDSRPDELRYTLLSLPARGELRLRNAVQNPENPDRALQEGDTFTQADVERGRLIFDDTNTDADEQDEGSEIIINLRLSDGSAFHPTEPETVTLVPYRPEESASSVPLNADDLVRRQFFQFISSGTPAVLWDLSLLSGSQTLTAPSAGLTASGYAQMYRRQFGRDKSMLILGSVGADVLSGGMEDDWIAGGPGDDRLTGGGGSDRFLYHSPESGNDTLLDFRVDQLDILDLRGALQPSSTILSDYVRLSREGDDVVLEVDPDGAGNDEAESFAITLAGVVEGIDPSSYTLRGLHEKGCLHTEGLTLPPVISIATGPDSADENDLRSSFIVIRREGDTREELTVPLHISGSATNGVDYRQLPEQAYFAPGETEARIVIEPYADSLSEGTETIEFSLVGGDGYELSSSASARIVIEDLAPRFSLEVLESLALSDPLTPARILVRRSGLMEGKVLVRLAYSGSATNGEDYESLPAYLSFEDRQASSLLEFVPRKSGESAEPFVKQAAIVVMSDSAYRSDKDAGVMISLAPKRMTFAFWSDQDGLDSSLSAYAFPSVERDGRGKGSAELSVMDDQATIAFTPNLAALDLEYTVEVSTDLQHWRSGAEHVQNLSVPAAGVRSRFRSTVPLSVEPRQFLRVRVNLR